MQQSRRVPSAVGQHRPGMPSAEHVGCTSQEAWSDEGGGGGEDGGNGVSTAPLEPASDSLRFASSTQMECSARAASMKELSKGDVLSTVSRNSLLSGCCRCRDVAGETGSMLLASMLQGRC